MNCSPDYLLLADLSLRSFASPELQCWSSMPPSSSRRCSAKQLPDWHTLISPYDYPTDLLLDSTLPPSPTDTCSSTSTTPSPAPRSPRSVYCNAPLVAPIPLPYHSPTFLQFELPDISEDLSHPPYHSRRSSTNSTGKRKRPFAEVVGREDDAEQRAPKRHARAAHPYQTRR